MSVLTYIRTTFGVGGKKKYFLVIILLTYSTFTMQAQQKLDFIKFGTNNTFAPQYAHLRLASNENKKLGELLDKHTLFGIQNLRHIVLEYMGPEKIELHTLTTPKLLATRNGTAEGYYYAASMSFNYDASQLPWLTIHMLCSHRQRSFIKWHAISGHCFGSQSIDVFDNQDVKDSFDEKQSQEITAQTQDGIYHASLQRPKHFIPLRQLKATIYVDQTALLQAVLSVKSKGIKKSEKQVVGQKQNEQPQQQKQKPLRSCSWRQ